MSSTWLSIRVDLVEGHCDDLWPRPGRIFAAARSHTFNQLATAIDDAFAAGTATTSTSSTSPTDRGSASPTQSGTTQTTPCWTRADLPSDGSRRASSSSTSSTSGTAGCTCAPSPRGASTPTSSSASSPAVRCPAGAGEPSPTKRGARVVPGYGARRVYAELTLGRGLTVGRGAVELLMGRAGIHGLPGPPKSRLILPKLTTAGDLPRAPQRPGFVTAGTTAPARAPPTSTGCRSPWSGSSRSCRSRSPGRCRSTTSPVRAGRRRPGYYREAASSEPGLPDAVRLQRVRAVEGAVLADSARRGVPLAGCAAAGAAAPYRISRRQPQGRGLASPQVPDSGERQAATRFARWSPQHVDRPRLLLDPAASNVHDQPRAPPGRTLVGAPGRSPRQSLRRSPVWSSVGRRRPRRTGQDSRGVPVAWGAPAGGCAYLVK